MTELDGMAGARGPGTITAVSLSGSATKVLLAHGHRGLDPVQRLARRTLTERAPERANVDHIHN